MPDHKIKIPLRRKWLRFNASEISGCRNIRNLNSKVPELASDALEAIEGDPIGEGGFAKVYKGVCGDREVAVKEFSIDLKGRDAFESEIAVFKKVKHACIVKVHGYIKFRNYDHFNFVKPPRIIMEFAEHGSLAYQIFMKGPIHWYERGYRYANSIAKGMVYLHRKHFVHLDMKTANVLVFNNDIVKIADMGLALKEEALTDLKEFRGTLEWIAPEVFELKYSKRCDTYGFGLILWSMLTGQMPWWQYCSDMIRQSVLSGQRPSLTDQPMDEALRKLIEACWIHDPEERLSDRCLIKMLKKMSHRSISRPAETESLIPYSKDSSTDSFGFFNHKRRQRNVSAKCDFDFNSNYP